MTEHQDRLREAFTKHENETPDPAVVYARVEELAKRYTWRRRGAQAAGGVALSAGLIAGVTQLPAILPAGPAVDRTTTIPAFQPAAPAPSVTPSVTPSTGRSPDSMTDQQINQGHDAYFEAGYGYDNALQLANLWGYGPEYAGDVKALAGLKLLAGETLPVNPVPNPTGEAEAPTANDKRITAYFHAGYDYEDAVELAKIWKLADPYAAKVEAGKRLLAGVKKLPVTPDPEDVKAGLEAKRVDTFFNAGYDYADATRLADMWNLESEYAAKVEAGKRLLAGKKLPIKP